MTEPKQRRKPRKYTDEFKQQLVELYRSGKRRCDICREYDIATSLFDKCVAYPGRNVRFYSAVEEFDAEYPLSFLMELYKLDMLYDLFILPALVPN